MSAIPPVPPIDAASISSQIDAFRSALDAGGMQAASDPNAIGRAMMSGLDDFRARETEFRAASAEVISGDGTRVDMLDAGPGEAMPATVTPTPLGSEDGGRMVTAAQSQRHTLGLMMQTYSFALEATLVTNAATTFTNSVNTLIKTQ